MRLFGSGVGCDQMLREGSAGLDGAVRLYSNFL